MADPRHSLEKPTLDKDLEKLSFIEAATQFVLSRAAAPGLAIIFLVLAALFSALYVSASPTSIAIVAASVLAAYMAMNIGANDVTNNVGAAVGAKAISMVGALLVAAVFEIAGAVFAGGNVVQTIKADIINPGSIPDTDIMIAIMMSALLAAAIWINIATWINAPVSTTHSIVGGIVGAGTMCAGLDAIQWSVMLEIALSWVLSPILGAAIAIGFLWFIKEKIIYAEDKVEASRKWVPVLLAVMTGAFVTYLLLVARDRFAGLTLTHALLAGLVLGLASLFRFRIVIARQAVSLENRNQSLKVLFRIPLIFSAALLSFAHGANDVSNAIGPLAAIIEAAGLLTVSQNMDAPFWVTLIGALGISVGLLLFGPRLIRIVGSQITKLNPVRAFCVAISAAITVIIASALGLPVSSTHIAVGAVFGVGLFREWYTANSPRRRAYILTRAGDGEIGTRPIAVVKQSARDDSEGHEPSFRFLVRRSYLMSILAAWIVTVPVSAALGAGLAYFLKQLLA